MQIAEDFRLPMNIFAQNLNRQLLSDVCTSLILSDVTLNEANGQFGVCKLVPKVAALYSTYFNSIAGHVSETSVDDVYELKHRDTATLDTLYICVL